MATFKMTSIADGAVVEAALNGAITANIGLNIASSVTDFDDLDFFGMLQGSNAASNSPSWAGSTNMPVAAWSVVTNRIFQLYAGSNLNTCGFRTSLSGSFGDWHQFFHDGNTGVLSFDDTIGAAGTNFLRLGDTLGKISLGRPGISDNTMLSFSNDNGKVGDIVTNGSATAFNTSSDPRLKDFKGQPADKEINTQFNLLFDCFNTFNWKVDPDGVLVWGFDAHACIDAGLDMGSEGEGSRDLELGEVYDITPAVIGSEEVPVLYKTGEKKGEPRFNTDGSPMMQTIVVEIQAAIEHKVLPAGIDQAKAVPILLAKIEQLERRLSALET